MPFVTDKQLEERKVLKKVVETVTKVEPMQWANEIHQRVLAYQVLNYTVDSMIEKLDVFLKLHSIRTCTGGDNVDGWKHRTVELSEKQRKKILTVIELMLRTGGRFSDYDEVEIEAPSAKDVMNYVEAKDRLRDLQAKGKLPPRTKADYPNTKMAKAEERYFNEHFNDWGYLGL